MDGTLVIKASGGMSNRLQAVLLGAGFCLHTGRRLHVDWRDGLYADSPGNVFHEFFRLRGVEEVETLPKAAPEDIAPEYWRENLARPEAIEYLFDNTHFRPEVVEATSIDLGGPDVDAPVAVGWAPNLDWYIGGLLPRLAEVRPEFAGLDAVAAAGRLLREHVVLREDLAERVERTRTELFPADAPVCGVHVRHTDLESPLEEFIRVMAAKRAENPRTRFLVCTDNVMVQRTLGRLFPGSFWTEKMMPEPGEVLHGHLPGEDNVEKGRQALVDMYLLAHCSEIIHFAPSSFARIPILLAGLPPSRSTAIG
ncbi:nodulation protein NodZ [Desulfohalovibrio reitneri]|uniref:nodulation protein NodZ n=1 Tax=Desulfohalovibrio reitneri TaxID=1307759 RepID=UPI0004A72BD4|nr:nodulation protein NodZ [Desulfohalovibrio reitneri]